ncbi:lanC-like protein 3 [Patiria miniata]|uniref:LanC-like protein 3 n=1 Tax=Patiria miniata TaxID=46514 RepID=A0A914A5I5_PATMI|nr:lanC-like protein 3 [Patiria miniata]
MRYFTNRLPDYKAGTPVEIPHEHFRERVTSIVDAVAQHVQPRHLQNCEGGLYVGSAGVAYSLLHITRTGQFPKESLRYLGLCKQYLVGCVEYESRSKKEAGASFLCGACGVHAVGALYSSSSKSEASNHAAAQYLESYAGFAKVCTPVKFLGPSGSDELLVGRAGYLCGVQLLAQKLGKQVLSQEALHTLCKVVVESGRNYSKRHHSQSPLMYSYYDTEYLGAAHGLSGILQVLLGFPDFIKSDPSIEKDIRDSVDFLVKCQTEHGGNIPPALDECGRQTRPAEHELVHWCHGAPGVVYLFAKAYLTWKDEAYLQACLRCGDVTWEKGLLKKGPGLCHGIAGSGYVFLLLHRLTGDKKHLHRALQFAAFMEEDQFRREARVPDAPYSLYEGLAGTACFLADLLEPEKAEFPFFNVF